MRYTIKNLPSTSQINRLNSSNWKIEKLSDSHFAIWMPASNSKTGYRLYAYKASHEQATKTINSAKLKF